MDLWWFFKFFCDAFCLFICCCLVMVTTFISKVASAQDKVHATYIIFHSLWWLHWLDVAVCTNVSDALIVCFWKVSSGGFLLEGDFSRERSFCTTQYTSNLNLQQYNTNNRNNNTNKYTKRKDIRKRQSESYRTEIKRTINLQINSDWTKENT